MSLTRDDDHSRFCVIPAVVRRATARAVCRAFVAAMLAYGIPDEVLSDNGKQFTGRFGKPRPAEVLFERICRRNGIHQRLTKPYSPTTTGKVERWDQHRAPERNLRDHPVQGLRKQVIGQVSLETSDACMRMQAHRA